jgi:hypothetical protein
MSLVGLKKKKEIQPSPKNSPHTHALKNEVSFSIYFFN